MVHMDENNENSGETTTKTIGREDETSEPTRINDEENEEDDQS